MPFTKSIRRQWAIALLVIFTSPIVLRTLHFVLVKHDFFAHQSEKTQFHRAENTFCAYQHDVYSEFLNENTSPSLIFSNLYFCVQYENPMRVYRTALQDNRSRAPPISLLFYRTI